MAKDKEPKNGVPYPPALEPLMAPGTTAKALAEEAMQVAFRFIQANVGQNYGDLASQIYSGTGHEDGDALAAMEKSFERYILTEQEWIKGAE